MPARKSIATGSLASTRFCTEARALHRPLMDVLQNGQSFMPLFWAAIWQPKQIFFMQHSLKPDIGQKSSSGRSSPCVYSRSSFSSAAHFLHAPLCCLRWAIWQSTLQYFTRRQAVQFLSLAASLGPLPQFAQASTELPLICLVERAIRPILTNTLTCSSCSSFFCLRPL